MIFGVHPVFLWLMITAATGQVKLSSNETQACPGETVKFTCMVYNGAQLQWTIPFDRAITFLPVHSPGRVVNRTGVVANLTSVQRHPLNNLAANMTSTLTYRAWNNTEVSCEEELISVNMSSHPAAPTNVSGEQLTCDANQLSLLVGVSWEAPSDTNCTHCTVLSTTTGYASHQVVCDGGTAVSVELNCSETYNISFTTVNKCGQRSNITTVEITLSINGTTTQATTEVDPMDMTSTYTGGTQIPTLTSGTQISTLTSGEKTDHLILGIVIFGAFVLTAIMVIAIGISLVRNSRRKPSLEEGKQNRRINEKECVCLTLVVPVPIIDCRTITS